MNEKIIAQVVKSVVKQTLSGPKMNLKLANALSEKVKEKACEMGIAVVIAVSDASARPVSIQCMDGAYIGSYDIALNKTFTSAGFKMSTQKLGTLCAPGESLYGIQYTNEGKVVVFGGGEPLFIGDEMIGALGVSGGTAEEDTKLAAYGKSILEEVIACL